VRRRGKNQTEHGPATEKEKVGAPEQRRFLRPVAKQEGEKETPNEKNLGKKHILSGQNVKGEGESWVQGRKEYSLKGQDPVSAWGERPAEKQEE